MLSADPGPTDRHHRQQQQEQPQQPRSNGGTGKVRRRSRRRDQKPQSSPHHHHHKGPLQNLGLPVRDGRPDESEDPSSSSTEGPESPGDHSSDSSLVPAMMIPAYEPAAPKSSSGADPGVGRQHRGHQHHHHHRHHLAAEACCSGEDQQLRDEDDPSGEAASSPLLPRFAVRVTDDVVKDGASIRYKLKVKQLDAAVAPVASRVLEKEFEDFEGLHHNLMLLSSTGASSSEDETTHAARLAAVIAPPLPPRPAVDPKETEKRSRRQLGSGNRSMRGDDLAAECAALDKYLQLVLLHPVFGHDPNLARFLGAADQEEGQAEAPVPAERAPVPAAKVQRWTQRVATAAASAAATGPGFHLTSLLDSMTSSSRQQVVTLQVCPSDEDFFVKEREWAALYNIHVRDARDKFDEVVHAHRRLANQLGHLTTALGGSVGGSNETLDSTLGQHNRLKARFGSGGLAEERKGLEARASVLEQSLGSYLTLWCRYSDQELATLNRRTALVQEAEAASRALAKATLAGKAAKTSVALAAREEKERDLWAATKLGESEVRRFHQQRVNELKETLVKYAEVQVKAAKDTHLKMQQCLAEFLQIPPLSADEVVQLPVKDSSLPASS